MGYLKPLPRRIQRGQRFGANPGWGPNPAGGHNGDDYLSQVGEPVYAAGDGVVVFAGRFDSTYADNWGWNLNFGGQMVVLNLDGDTAPYVEYGHLSEVRVSAGDRVRAAQVIALTGADDGGTGVITGPHLHVGCLPPNFDLGTNTYGRVNPDIYLTDYPDETGTIIVQSATITPVQEEPLVPNESDRVFYHLDGGEKISLNEFLNDLIREARSARAAMQALLSVQLPDPSEPGKTYALADYIVWGATNAKNAAGAAAVAAVNTDPATISKAVSDAQAGADAQAIADRLQVTVKDGK